ncbi:hypothetical protein LEP1GSC087_1079 [Leptospira interrogans serovar Bataviae str. L1111]|nr:hypothetical protein LEP1GSC087_1079 [Leptospira interrogans serovar Bataviae str. L1111]
MKIRSFLGKESFSISGSFSLDTYSKLKKKEYFFAYSKFLNFLKN